MVFPDTDTRRLKRRDGMFTIERREEFESDKSICRFCARERCAIRRTAKTHSDRALVSIRACKEFIPVLGFSVLDGLDLARWNTIRLGRAWDSRLEPGMWVAIANLKERCIVRHMRVTETVVLPIGAICDTHGVNNHAVLGRGIEPEDAPAAMMKILRGAYGSNFASADRDATAIYLEE